MSSEPQLPSQFDRARRHFLGLAVSAGAKVAAISGISSLLLQHPAWAKRRGRPGHRCFLRGTAILTPAGEIPVEDLKPGDRVRTAAGGTMPIRWVGRQTFRKSGSSWHRDVVPIRIARSALEEGTPHADLYVSGHHALLIDGVLIRAKDLVNGTTIKPALPEGREAIEYFHILLDRHEVILAEGAPAETFLAEAGNHEMFSNFAELAHQFPAGALAMTPVAPIMGCRGRDHLNALLSLARHPFTAKGDPLEATRQRLAHRARFVTG